MHLSRPYRFSRAVAMECRYAAHYVHNLAVARVRVRSARRPGAQPAHHYLALAVVVVAREQLAMTALETCYAGFINVVEVYCHPLILLLVFVKQRVYFGYFVLVEPF